MWPSTTTPAWPLPACCPDQKAETTIAFLEQALDFFARHGIGVRALLTDNGSSYRSWQFARACQQLAIEHRRTRPYSPQTNGKAERFIQTALREWAYQNTGQTPIKQTCTCNLGTITTTGKDPMVAPNTSRPSAAPIKEQSLDHLQAPVLYLSQSRRHGPSHSANFPRLCGKRNSRNQ